MTNETATERWEKTRNAAGFLSDTALIRHLGVSTDSIWRWSREGAGPRPVTARRVAKALHISLDALDKLFMDMHAEYREGRQAGSSQLSREV